MNKNNYCVIMAGGIGSRFWPLSKTSNPKQFLDILGTGKTLIQQTFDRFKKICPTDNIYIVTNILYEKLVIEQLPEIKKENILSEPMKRNTAPCIAYASFKIMKENPDANLIVAPSDHLILNEENFVSIVASSFDFISQNKDVLLTIGIKPTRPETGYGYIQINQNGNNNASSNYHKVKTFTEKPIFEMAKIFFESGEFFWNAGIFMWSVKAIINSFKTHLNDIYQSFNDGIEYYNTDKEKDFLHDAYSKCKNISIDYGIMEKADNVFVVCAEFGWSDLGTWGSLYENLDKDNSGNAVVGNNVLSYDTKNCIVNAPKGKLVVLQGLEDYIVAESDNVLLICQKSNEQQIRQFVTDVKHKKGDEFV